MIKLIVLTNVYRSATYNRDFSPLFSEEPISPLECFTLLKEACCSASGPSPNPSWSLFHSFIVFMYTTFRGMETYGLFVSGGIDIHLKPFVNIKCRRLIYIFSV